MKITTAMFHEQAFGPWFRDRDTWRAWIVFLSALFALDMDEEQATLYRHHTGRSELPTAEAKEAWLVCGRRAGKSFILALVAVFIACFREYRQHLTPGERGTILIIATDRKQARVIMRYVKALLTEVPMLKRLVIAESAESVELSNRIIIEVGTASFKSTRGYTFVAVLCDEIAFWPTDDAADPDFEILNAVRPGMATIPNAMLLCASSPHSRSGALWEAFDQFFGVDGAPLVWKASTREMNPTVPQELIDSEYGRDAAKASAEYGANFRSDLEAFVPLEAVRACIAEGVSMRPPRRPALGQPPFIYHAFVDPSGGMSDSMTLAIGHDETRRSKEGPLAQRKQRDIAVLDLLIEVKPPFKPERVVSQFADALRQYGVGSVTGDAYAAEWTADAFRRNKIKYQKSPLTRSEIFLNFLPLLNDQSVELLDHDGMANQFTGLQRRVTSAGRESVDHKPGSHDDVANAAAGVATLIARLRQRRAKTMTSATEMY